MLQVYGMLDSTELIRSTISENMTLSLNFVLQNGGEDIGCNFFKWCSDIGFDERGSYAKSKGVKSESKKKTLVNSEEMDSIRKMIVNLYKSVFIV